MRVYCCPIPSKGILEAQKEERGREISSLVPIEASVMFSEGLGGHSVGFLVRNEAVSSRPLKGNSIWPWFSEQMADTGLEGPLDFVAQPLGIQ